MSEPRNWQKEYDEAVYQEQTTRDLSFLTDFDFICDEKVKSLTPSLLSVIHASRNPFAIGGSITSEKILGFLFIVRHNTDEGQEAFFTRIINTYPSDVLFAGINDYISQSFQDAPEMVENGKSTRQYFSSIASVVDVIASEYSWPEKDILNIPYKRLWQYIRAIRKRLDPEKKFFNKSDHIISEYMQSIQPKI